MGSLTHKYTYVLQRTFTTSTSKSMNSFDTKQTADHTVLVTSEQEQRKEMRQTYQAH